MQTFSYPASNRIIQLTTTEAACLTTLADLIETEPTTTADQLARCLHFTPETMLSTLQSLFKRQLINATTVGSLTLTANGWLLAHHYLIQHRLLERFLLDVVGVPWIFVHREAARLAQMVSPCFIERVIVHTRQATVCPHGNPIPGRSTFTAGEVSLSNAPLGQRCRLTRIAEWICYDPQLVRHLWSYEIVPGCTLIRVPDPLSKTVIQLNQRPTVLGQRIAQALYVVVE
ncbi:metal-dependent transcriptional regulator [Chloroflexus aggregans]|uniref:Iron (Metal) dependent repressor, DtxR family n=1 Tax=Chloroflexus aggregans (strain MD-66 / DSM 9485) TaxID=326427 RepID=B8G898_CHLAD|nr:metal-dependent transcriptional regulator [Chloroflexus aggregans]ACL26152.1 iron (metal) dependent repressor, DtxR family [Chloroflexus aggregans DSM 9485]